MGKIKLVTPTAVACPTGFQGGLMGACDERWPWFAIQVRTSKETTVTNLLQNRDYECFLPLGKSRRRWSDRIKEFEVPLFPGYVFCRFDVHNRLPILKTPGVLQIVAVAKIPAPIDDAEIAAIQCLGRSGLLTQQWPFLQVGQRARIDYGPLRGLTGIVVGIKSELKLVLSVALLQRSVAVEVERDWLSELDQFSPVAAPVAPDRSFLSRQAIAPCRASTITNPEGQLA